MKYIVTAKHCKYSVSDDVYKIFNHKLYTVTLESYPENMNEDTFLIDKSRYKWMSIEEMERDERVMEVNEEIVAFVKAKCQ
ncbi:hypothetical protein [Catonella massiliensis]|uniref:Uncharacterized protein n=1 Tax=Catonella massiliensis TaxID=2799636 RepID=A0ABS1J2X7_9FIRM|nr:hypothetical protein [Catonella massiliensis]MBK5898505.1 hypothetical protein [Catonella massiliensis]